MKYVDLKGNYLNVIQFNEKNFEKVKKFIEDYYTFVDSKDDLGVIAENGDIFRLIDSTGKNVDIFVGDYFLKDSLGVMHPLEKEFFESLVVRIPESPLDELRIELDDLDKRMDSMSDALMDEEYAGLFMHLEDKEMIVKQINCMQEYKEILEKRIYFWSKICI